MSISLCSEKLEHYQHHRSTLIKFCDKASEVLRQASSEQRHHEPYSTPVEKLKADTYTLVLIGAFQSGKSTLFNYLCDGRELSPVGPNGGGIRTSGCKVTAHPLPEGEPERAEIIWRSPAQLLSALGGRLIEYFEEPTCASSLTEHEIDLNKPEDREKLAALAWHEWLENKNALTGGELELLRFTLIVCKFYDQFAERCKVGKSVCSADEAVKLSSYPQDWAKKWADIEEKKDASLTGISVEDVNFAFCGGVDFYLDSPILRDLGCSIIDCPGLFVSKWDTEIAEKCIKEANAILYMFAGVKSLSQEDKEALNSTVRMGGCHKIMFGANLRIDKHQWAFLLENGVIPSLKTLGFEKPTVHNFHSGIALRARELCLLKCNALHPVSEVSIKSHIDLSKKQQSVEKYLSKQLNKFIGTLTDDEKELADFDDDFNAMEELSGVPAFLKAANEHVVENRAVSVLIHEGTQQVEDSLRQAEADLSTIVRMMESDIDSARTVLEETQAKLDSFRKSRELHETDIANAVAVASRLIEDYYKNRVSELIESKREALVKITESNMINVLRLPFIDTNKRIRAYSSEVGKVFSEVLETVRNEILNNFVELDPFKNLRDQFEGHRKELQDKLDEFKDVKGIVNMSPFFPESFADNVNGLVLPHAERLLAQVFAQDKQYWEFIKTILSFGLNRLYISNRHRAEDIVVESLGEFKRQVFESLKNVLYQEEPAGPLKVLQNAVGDFMHRFKNASEKIQKTVDEARTVLDKAHVKADSVPSLRELCKKLQSLQLECKDIETGIRSDFPV